MMNKAPLMVMTALALAAGSVAAQSTLQIYGTLDASVTHGKAVNTAVAPLGITAGKASTTAVSSGTMTGSYIGFKGTEDLGGGMEASFVLESYLNLDSGATSANTQLLSFATRAGLAQQSVPGALTATWNTRDEGAFWARNAYVALKTNYGLIRLGQMDSLGYLAAGNYNPFGHASVSPSKIFYTTDYYGQGWSNTLGYYLKVGDFTGALQYSPKNDSAASTGGKTAVAVRYTAGPLSASLGFEQNKDNVGAVPAEAKSWALHSSYDLGVAKLFAQYGKGKLDRVSPSLPDVESTGYQLGTSVPVGNGAFMASFAKGIQKFDATGQTFREIKVFTVGYDYNLSKRTDVYAAYSDEQDSYPIVQLGNYKLSTDTLAVGIRHRF